MIERSQPLWILICCKIEKSNDGSLSPKNTHNTQTTSSFVSQNSSAITFSWWYQEHLNSLEQVLQVFNMRRHGFIQVTLGTTLPLVVHQISALWQYFWPLNAGHTISPLAFNPAHQDAAWPCMGQHLSLCCEETGGFWYAGISDLEPDASFRARRGRYEMYSSADNDRCLHSHRLYNYSCLRRLPASFLLPR